MYKLPSHNAQAHDQDHYNGDTALHIAAKKNLKEIVKILLQHPSINPKLENQSHLIPRANAVLVKANRIEQYLRAAENKYTRQHGPSPFPSAAVPARGELIQVVGETHVETLAPIRLIVTEAGENAHLPMRNAERQIMSAPT